MAVDYTYHLSTFGVLGIVFLFQIDADPVAGFQLLDGKPRSWGLLPFMYIFIPAFFNAVVGF